MKIKATLLLFFISFLAQAQATEEKRDRLYQTSYESALEGNNNAIAISKYFIELLHLLNRLSASGHTAMSGAISQIADGYRTSGTAGANSTSLNFGLSRATLSPGRRS